MRIVEIHAQSPRRSLAATLLVLLGLIGATACTSTRAEAEQAGRRELSMEMFRSLIEEGTLTPVDTMGDSFDTLAEGMDGDNYLDELLKEFRGSRDGGGRSSAAVPDAEEVVDVEVPDPALEESSGSGDEPEVIDVINPYAEFGPRILVHADREGNLTGLITKPYSVRPGMGEKIMWLLENYGGFEMWDPESGAQQIGTLRAENQPDFEIEQFATDLRSDGPDQGQKINIADWVLATADRETLGDFEYFLDVMFAGPPQIEIEAKIVEYVLSDTLDIGLGPIDDSTPMVGLPESGLFDSFNWSFPNQSGTTEFLTSLRAVHDGTAYNFLLEMLASYENIEITSRPKVAVREGTRARIESVQKIPYYQIGSVNQSGGVNASLNYHEVGVKMWAIPRLVGGSTISLEIEVEASQQVGSEISFITTSGQAITTPTLGIRKSNTLVYLKPGQAVILGGLITERNVEDEKKIPFLGDIPILGFLFRSTYQRKELVSVLFFIRPRILEGIDLHRDF
jgi:type II secretory pathway component GspD/PulD (secretin)